MNFEWGRLRGEWEIPDGVTYLNHGSFGPAPRVVQQERIRLLVEMENQPMDFYVRRLEDLWDVAADKLGKFVNASGRDLIFVPNATVGMNLAAENIDLESGDEVLLTDQEYGAVVRIWGRVCGRVGARTVLGEMPLGKASDEEMVETLFRRVTPRTKVIVVSHVTSPTAVTFPVEKVCARARERGIRVCIDGPHAPAMVPIDLARIDCDYYAASCHKWLSAPLGTGFLYVKRRHQGSLEPLVMSWGRSLQGRNHRWQDEFVWPGTDDPTGYLSVPVAIEFLERVGVERFREETHGLANLARRRLGERFGARGLVEGRYGSMVTMEMSQIPKSEGFPGSPHPWQMELWNRAKIEIPIIEWKGKMHLRVSCHLYNCERDLDVLEGALDELIREQQR